MTTAGRALAAVLCTVLLTVMMAAPATATAPTWKAIESPGSVADSTGNHLLAVDCWSPGNCVAVGYHYAESSLDSYVVEDSGGTWSYVPTTAEAMLTGVSCPAAGSCVAIGNTTGSDPEALLLVQSASGWTQLDATGA